ncbi:MAG: hypothetical protein JW720_13030 [Sedimentisphaerales bacterium]|nr:hypothetical protein [Sedimentisphaerales bacterium]
MAENTSKIEHVIPHIGLATIPLYPPADKLYSLLLKCQEIERLKTLLHLGALSEALPGARHARWDYTVSLLYYAQALKLRGMNSAFTLGITEFSSAQAALQTIALCWNIGHLPGTFLVEKGVYRWLYETNKENPANKLKWPRKKHSNVPLVRKEANRLLREQDYLGLARVLAVIKLLSMLNDTDSELRNLVLDFAAPFLLSYEGGDSKQWFKLSRAFTIVRHLAYLTLDISLAGLEWCPSIPSLLRQEIDREGTDLQELSDRIGEVLSPIERLVYASLYHRDTARKEAAIVADWVYGKLKQSNNAKNRISSWMKKGALRDLRIGNRPPSGSVVIAGSIRLRTHFVGTNLSPAEIELSLRRKNFMYPLALNYQAWNSEAMIEPDELIIDGIVAGTATSSDIGRLLSWMIRQFESPDAGADDTYELLRKADFENTYVLLVKRAFELAFPGKTATIEPWPLSRFGLFAESPPEGSRGCVWACDGKLADQISKHIVRDRSRTIPTVLKDRYAELLGIRALRNHLRSKWRDKRLRQRCLLVTASVRFRDSERDLIEFDGGIAVVSSRGGYITWYGLESKRGSGDPFSSLKNRLEDLGLPTDVHKLSARHAFAKLTL